MMKSSIIRIPKDDLLEAADTQIVSTSNDAQFVNSQLMINFNTGNSVLLSFNNILKILILTLAPPQFHISFLFLSEIL